MLTNLYFCYGVGWYDYGFRFYDSQLARFHTIDPLAEKYYPISPFAYVANNPLRFIDPDGREIWIAYHVYDKKGRASVQEVQYKNGNLYDKDGGKYSGNNSYVSKVAKDLNKLSTSDDVLNS